MMNKPVLITSEQPPGERREELKEESHRPPILLEEWRERITASLLRATLGLGLLVLIAETALNVQLQRWDLVGVIAGIYLLFAAITFVRRIPTSVRAGVLIALLYALGVLSLSQSGLGGEGRILMLIVPLLALILVSARVGAVMMGICTFTLIGAGVLMGGGFWVPPIEPHSTDPLPWVTAVVVYLLLAAVTLVPPAYVINNLIANLRRALEEARHRWHEVRELTRGLERQVEERTADLSRRSAQLEAAAQVGREVAAIRDVGRLLQEAVRMIADRFGLFHVGIFLLDTTGEWAVLKAASSDGGRRMIQRGHRLRVGVEGPVGEVASTGRPRVVRGVGEGTVLPSEPELPQARVQTVLPLVAHGRIIGVLDLRSSREEVFEEDDVAILQVMADQIALAIENARLLTESQRALERLSRYRVEETLKAWRGALLRRGVHLAYLYDQTTVRPVPADETPLPWGRGGMPQKINVHSYPDGRSVLVAPIRVYDRTIGVLTFEARRAWRKEEIAFVEEAVEQMGLALENARLLEETRRRAERERIIADITAKVRASADVETILRTAVREIGAALGTDRTFVQLKEVAGGGGVAPHRSGLGVEEKGDARTR